MVVEAVSAGIPFKLAEGHETWTALRRWLTDTVTADGPADAVGSSSYPVDEVALHLSFTVADYVDHYASEHHASNIGKMSRPDQAPLLPNWKHLPVGYHGRSGTVLELSRSEGAALLADGREMGFLQDGQTVTLRGTAPGPDGSLIDFGGCTATILRAT